MRLEYTLTREDYYEFADFGMKNTDEIKKQLNIQRLMMGLIFTIVAGFFIFNRKLELKRVLPIYFLAIGLWLFLFPKLMEKAIGRRLNKSLDKNSKLLKERVVELRDQGFYVITEEEDLLVTEEFYRVINAENSIYLYIDRDSAYIIPKRAFGAKEDIREFLKLARSISQN